VSNSHLFNLQNIKNNIIHTHLITKKLNNLIITIDYSSYLLVFINVSIIREKDRKKNDFK